MIARSLLRRKLCNYTINGIAGLASLVGLFFLAWILVEILARGGKAINWSFFTELPSPAGVEGGGLVHAIYGTFVLTVLATLLGVPVGMLAGVYLAEFGMGTRLAALVRFFSNILMGTPSIIVGVFVYTLLVIPMQGFSGYAGAVALAILMLPLVARTTEDMLNLVPNQLREAALGLGAPRWRVTLQIVFREARSGLLTGVLLAVARISGETAPLLFTALNYNFWKTSLQGPMPNLTVTIYNYAMSPFENWQQLAWGGALLITVSVLLLTVLARFCVRGRKGS
ncbi:MAG: phosphate ABC transporter permease PstA [bacterium]|jgi:phosphate transport system permease protein|nr:phosphate ABC transporter permease PstA [bacterium]